jgi:hypothetical protein
VLEAGVDLLADGLGVVAVLGGVAGRELMVLGRRRRLIGVNIAVSSSERGVVLGREYGPWIAVFSLKRRPFENS